MEISTRELHALVADADDEHHESLPALRAAIEEIHRGDTARLISAERRRFLKRAGTGIAVAGAGLNLGLLTGRAAAQTADEVGTAGFAAGVELAAVAAYEAAAGRGLLDQPVVDAALVFAGHHTAHAATFNSLLGDAPVTAPDAGLLETFGPMIAAAADGNALLEIAYTLESAAAATYFSALGVVTTPAVASAIARILPVEAQHASALAFALGKEPAAVTPETVNATGSLV